MPIITSNSLEGKGASTGCIIYLQIIAKQAFTRDKFLVFTPHGSSGK